MIEESCDWLNCRRIKFRLNQLFVGEALHDEAKKATKEVTTCTWQSDKTMRGAITNQGPITN